MYKRNHPAIAEEFVGKYLIPTDSIYQQNEDIVKKYIRDMKEGQQICPIRVATDPPSRVNEFALVSDLVKENVAIYILDGHHRYIASLAPTSEGYPLEALFVDQDPGPTKLGSLYDYLDAYAYWEKYKIED